MKIKKVNLILLFIFMIVFSSFTYADTNLECESPTSTSLTTDLNCLDSNYDFTDKENLKISCNGNRIIFNGNLKLIVNSVTRNISFYDCDFFNFNIQENDNATDLIFFNSTFSGFDISTIESDYILYDDYPITALTIIGKPAKNASIGLKADLGGFSTSINLDSEGMGSSYLLRETKSSGVLTSYDRYTVNITYQNYLDEITGRNLSVNPRFDFVGVEDHLKPGIIDSINASISNNSINLIFNTTEEVMIKWSYDESIVEENLDERFNIEIPGLESSTKYSIELNLSDEYGNYNVTYFNISTWSNPNITFKNISFDEISHYGNASNATLNISSSLVKISFKNANLTKINISNETLVIRENYVYLNDSALVGLNTSAIINLSVSNYSLGDNVVVYKNNYSNPVKTNITVGDGWVLFNVSSFSFYTTGYDANLSLKSYTNQANVADLFTFSVNYSNISNKGFINDGDCEISFDDGSFSMIMDDSTKTYNFSRVFLYEAYNQSFNVTCLSPTRGLLRINDSYNVTTLPINSFKVFDNLTGDDHSTINKTILLSINSSNLNYSVKVTFDRPISHDLYSPINDLTDWINIGNNTFLNFTTYDVDSVVLKFLYNVTDPNNASRNITNYTLSDGIFKHDKTLFFNVRSIVPGKTVSNHSDGILFIDDTAPIFKDLKFETKYDLFSLENFNGSNVFSRFRNSLKIGYWIRDLESGLQYVRYALGIKKYDSRDFDSKQTWTNIFIDETGLTNQTLSGSWNLEEGQTYHLVIEAKNNRLDTNPLIEFNTTWPILIDTLSPINTSINLTNYTGRYYVTRNQTDIILNNGVDDSSLTNNISGVKYGIFKVRNASMSYNSYTDSIQCNGWSPWYVYYQNNSLISDANHTLEFNSTHGYCYEFDYTVYDYALNSVTINDYIYSDNTSPIIDYLYDDARSVYYRLSHGDEGVVLSLNFSGHDDDSGIHRYELCVSPEKGNCSKSIHNATIYYPEDEYDVIYNGSFEDNVKYYTTVSAYNNVNLDDAKTTTLGTVFLLVKVPVNNLSYFETDDTRVFDEYEGIRTNYRELVNWNIGTNTTINLINSLSQLSFNMTCRWFENDVTYNNYGNLCLGNGTNSTSCEIDTPVQGEYNISIACQNTDVFTVYQYPDENVDVSFIYDFNELPFIKKYRYDNGSGERDYDIDNFVVNVLEDSNVSLKFIVEENDTLTKFIYDSNLSHTVNNLTITYEPNMSRDYVHNNSLDIIFYNESSETNVYFNETTFLLNISFNKTISNQELLSILNDPILNLSATTTNESSTQTNYSFNLYRKRLSGGVSNTIKLLDINSTDFGGLDNFSWDKNEGIISVDLELAYGNLSGMRDFHFNLSDYINETTYSFTFNISEVNDPVELNYTYYILNNSFNMSEDSVKVINVSKYFKDADIMYGQHENLTYDIVNTTSGKYLNFSSFNNKTGILNLRPVDDYFGIQSFKVKAIDKGNESIVTDSILINISPVSDKPVINLSYNPNLNFSEDGIIEVDVSKFFYDVDLFYTYNGKLNDTLNYSINVSSNLDLVSFNNETGIAIITTNKLDYFGLEYINISVEDLYMYSNKTTAIVNVTPVNDDPIINISYLNDGNNWFTFDEDQQFNLNLSKYINQTYEENDFISFSVIYNSTGLGNNINLDNLTLVPDLNINGNNFYIIINVSDNVGGYNEFSLKFNITLVNDAPEIINISSSFNYNHSLRVLTVPEDSFINFDLDVIDVDLDSVSIISIESDFSDLNCNFNYPFNCSINLSNDHNNDYGVFNTTINISDSFLNNSFKFSLNITPIDDAPWINETYLNLVPINFIEDNSLININLSRYVSNEIGEGINISFDNTFNPIFNISEFDNKTNLLNISTLEDNWCGIGYFEVNLTQSDNASLSSIKDIEVGVNCINDNATIANILSNYYYNSTSKVLTVDEDSQFIAEFVFDEVDSLNFTYDENVLESIGQVNISANLNIFGGNLTLNFINDSAKTDLFENISTAISGDLIINTSFVEGYQATVIFNLINNTSLLSTNHSYYNNANLTVINISFNGSINNSDLISYVNSNVTLRNDISLTTTNPSEHQFGDESFIFYNKLVAKNISSNIDENEINITFKDSINTSDLITFWNKRGNNNLTFITSNFSSIVTESSYYFYKNISGGISNETSLLDINDSRFSVIGNNLIMFDLEANANNVVGLINLTINFTDYLDVGSFEFIVNITEVDDVPYINDTFMTSNKIIFGEEDNFTFNISSYLFDIDGGKYNLSIYEDKGVLESSYYNESNNSLKLIPNKDIFGVFNITLNLSNNEYFIMDNITINITNRNDAPRINGISYSIIEDDWFVINYSDNIYDIDLDSLSYNIINLSPYSNYTDLGYGVNVTSPNDINLESTIYFNLTGNDSLLTNYTIFNVTFIPVDDDIEIINSSIFSNSINIVEEEVYSIDMSHYLYDEEDNMTFKIEPNSDFDVSIIGNLISIKAKKQGTKTLTLNYSDDTHEHSTILTFNVANKPNQVSSGGSSGSSGGSSGGSFISILPVINNTDNNEEDIIEYKDKITHNKPVVGTTMILKSSLKYIDEISNNLKYNSKIPLWIMVSDIKNIELDDKVSYESFIISSNLNKDEFIDTKVIFNIDENWLKENNINDSSIKLYNVNGKTYREIPIEKIKENTYEATIKNKGQYTVTGRSFDIQESVSCFDGIQNGDESDIDCGGSCGLKCSLEMSCNFNFDCDSKFCSDNICKAKESLFPSELETDKERLNYTGSIFVLLFMFTFLGAVAYAGLVMVRHNKELSGFNALKGVPEFEVESMDIGDLEKTDKKNEKLLEKVNDLSIDDSSLGSEYNVVSNNKHPFLLELEDFAHKVFSNHGEDALVGLLKSKDYSDSLISHLVGNSKSRHTKEVFESDLTQSQKEYELSHDNARKRKEELENIKHMMKKINEELDNYE